MNIKYFISIIISAVISINSMTADIFTKNDAYNYAQTWADAKNTLDFEIIVIQNNFKKIVDNGIVVAYLFNLLPQGFITISTSNIDSPIIAYSFQNNFAIENSEEESIALGVMGDIGYSDMLISKEEDEKSSNRKISNTDFEIGPFVMSLWGQVNCTNNTGSIVNVSNYYTPNYYAPGCVAVSMATLIHHYNWPINGTGSHTYTDNYGSSKGTYSANFEETFYGWDNMLTRYKNRASTDYQREAEGLLVYQSAIALNMDFEYNGSTSNVNRIPNAGDDYFRYSSVHRYEYSAVFWQMLDTNMFHEIPVILSVSGNGYGHSIICDGIRIESDSILYYHLNMGWWGSTNGWYRIRDNFNAGGYSSVTGGVFDFVPIPALSSPVVDEMSETVTLSWQYAPNCIADAYEVQQKVDEGSWVTISDEIMDTTLDVNIVPSSNYAFRVRAQHKGKWSFSSWSEEERMSYLGIVDDIIMDDILFGPNPTNDFFNIYFPDNYLSVDIEIYNIFGVKIQSLKKQHLINEISISTNDWNLGMYIIRLSDGNNNKVIALLKTN